MPLDDDNHLKTEFVLNTNIETTVPSSIPGRNFVSFLFPGRPQYPCTLLETIEINDFVNSPKKSQSGLG